MRTRTIVIVVIVALVLVVLASPLFVNSNSSSNDNVSRSANVTIYFDDANKGTYSGTNTTWTKDQNGSWSHVSQATSDGTTVFNFVNVSFSSDVLDLLTASAGIGNFSIGKQKYTGMGTLITSIDGVANENPGRGWQFYVNGTYASEACDKVSLSGGENVVWKFMVLNG